MGHEHVTLQLTSLLISFCVKKKKYGFKFFSQQKGIYLSTLSIGNVHSVTRKHYVLAERKKKNVQIQVVHFCIISIHLLLRKDDNLKF